MGSLLPGGPVLSSPEEALERLARTPRLLVASDYDGTLAPIVADPARAFPEPGAPEALAALAALPDTRVAVLSGRALDDLARLIGRPAGVALVGSHGAETSSGLAARLPPAAARRLERLRDELAELAAAVPGAALEEKPAGLALHVRNAEPGAGSRLVAAVLAGPARGTGVWARRGKEVVELSVVDADKGRVLDDLRRRAGATRSVYLGDDRTDEDAFAVLGSGDLAVKVGGGPTRASHRLAGPAEAVRFLAALADRRRAVSGG